MATSPVERSEHATSPDKELISFDQAMEKLSREERFRATFEQAAVGIAHTEPEGRFLQVNQKLCEMLGYTRDELLGMSAIEVTHPEDRGIDAVRRAQLIAGELETYSVERRCVRKDGAMIWVKPHSSWRSASLIMQTRSKRHFGPMTRRRPRHAEQARPRAT